MSLQPYVEAMKEASGLSEFDAITSVLFAVATHIDLEQYPLLVYLGARATGKTAAMKQLFPMCKDSKWIHGTTVATQRSELKNVRTAFVDEADIIDGNAGLTGLYTNRYDIESGIVNVNVRAQYGTWELQQWNIFGATVMTKRAPIGDVALRSRAIIIHTTYQQGEYRLTHIGDVSEVASNIAERVKQSMSETGVLDRVHQTWNSFNVISQELGMREWFDESLRVQYQEAEALAGGQGYEPRDAVLQAIDILSREDITHARKDGSVRINEVVEKVREVFALSLKPQQIQELAQALGFDIGRTAGYPTVKVKAELLDALLPEEG